MYISVLRTSLYNVPAASVALLTLDCAVGQKFEVKNFVDIHYQSLQKYITLCT